MEQPISHCIKRNPIQSTSEKTNAPRAKHLDCPIHQAAENPPRTAREHKKKSNPSSPPDGRKHHESGLNVTSALHALQQSTSSRPVYKADGQKTKGTSTDARKSWTLLAAHQAKWRTRRELGCTTNYTVIIMFRVG